MALNNLTYLEKDKKMETDDIDLNNWAEICFNDGVETQDDAETVLGQQITLEQWEEINKILEEKRER